MPKEVKYRITAEDKSKKGLKNAERGLSRFKRSTSAITDSIKRMFVVTFGDITRIVSRAVRAITDSVKAFGEQKAVESNLAAAFSLVGANAEDGVARVEKLARAIQLLTTVGDEATLSAAAYGMQLGVSSDQIDSITVAAVGLSRKIKKDLNTAMMLLARSTQGQFDLFTRYGIALSDTMTDQEKFNEVMRLSAGGFSLAKAEGETLLGNIEQLGNAAGDMRQAMGGAMLQMVTGTTDIDATTESILKLADATSKSSKFFGLWGKAIKFSLLMASPAAAVLKMGVDMAATGADAAGLGLDATGTKKTSAPSREALFNSFKRAGYTSKSYAENEADNLIRQTMEDRAAGDGGFTGPAGGTKATKRARIGLSQAFDIARGEAGPNTSPELSLLQSIDDRLESMDGKL